MSKTEPSHYQLPNGFQVIDLTSQLDFCSGNVVKYVARAGNKDGESSLDDLKKAKYYLDRLISQELEKANESSSKAKVMLCPSSSYSVCDYVHCTVTGQGEHKRG